MATVELQGGVRAWEYPLPPDGFDPRAADEELLRRYGFPHRPRDAELLRIWERALSRPIEIVPPRYELTGQPRHRPVGVFEGASGWSGAQIQSASGQVFENVMGMWTVPLANPDPGYNGWSYCSSWVGIGDPEGQLLQAGIDANAYWESGSIGYQFSAWWELLPAPQQPLTVPVSAGDRVLCAIGYEQAPEGILGHVWFFNMNRNQGQIIPFTGPYLAATQAEWIVERPSKSPTPGDFAGPLALYGAVVFTGCYAIMTGSKESSNLSGGTAINMTGSNGNVISYGAILGNSTVECIWQGFE